MNEMYDVHLAFLNCVKKVVISVKIILFKQCIFQKTFLHIIGTEKLVGLPFNVID